MIAHPETFPLFRSYRIAQQHLAELTESHSRTDTQKLDDEMTHLLGNLQQVQKQEAQRNPRYREQTVVYQYPRATPWRAWFGADDRLITIATQPQDRLKIVKTHLWYDGCHGYRQMAHYTRIAQEIMLQENMLAYIAHMQYEATLYEEEDPWTVEAACWTTEQKRATIISAPDTQATILRSVNHHLQTALARNYPHPPLLAPAI